MAIAHRATGTASFGANSITPAIPTAQLTGDMMLLLAGGKPHDLGWSVGTAGWNALGEFSPGTAAAGVDTGSMKVQAWWKQATSDTETNPTLTEGSPTWNVAGALIYVFSKAATEEWVTPVFVGGGDTDGSTPTFSFDCDAAPGLIVGDHIVTYIAVCSDGAVPCSIHVAPGGITGGTNDTHDPSTDPESATGGDMGMCFTRSTLNADSSGLTNVGATLGGNAEGAGGIVRLRVRVPSQQYSVRRDRTQRRWQGFGHAAQWARARSGLVVPRWTQEGRAA